MCRRGCIFQVSVGKYLVPGMVDVCIPLNEHIVTIYVDDSPVLENPEEIIRLTDLHKK